jgi:hypothetical protein
MYSTYAQLLQTASVDRLSVLVESLEALHCKVRVDVASKLLELSIPEDQLDWVINGFITVFFDGFKDVAAWSFRFHSPIPLAAAA